VPGKLIYFVGGEMASLSSTKRSPHDPPLRGYPQADHPQSLFYMFLI